LSEIEVSEGRVWLKRSGVDFFCGDLTATEKELTWATAMAPVADLFDQKHDGVAWRTKPSAYIVGAQDRTVNPELERFAARRMGATTYELDSSHVPMLSQPAAAVDAIHNLVAACDGAMATA
jgi:pimeloyl-ACP methyl ester carboxylesterase